MSAHESTTGFAQSFTGNACVQCHSVMFKPNATALWETRHDNYEEAVKVHKDWESE